MIKSIIELLMTYFNDDRPVSLNTLKTRCDENIIKDAIANNYIVERKGSDGYITYTITLKGKEFRNK